jgi:hypothetical protein
MIGLPGFALTQTLYAEQMYKTGVVKTLPASGKDAFFPTAHGLPGS